MFTSSLYPKTAQVLIKLSLESNLKGWYLAGGTALALQIGHRKSIDLDFFTTNFPRHSLLLNNLAKHKPTVLQEDEGSLDTMIDTVKVSFLSYNYPTLEKGPKYDGVLLASIIDIACMKLSAISSRGAKKDFYDMYFILKHISLKELFVRFSAKFSSISYNDLHLHKSLVYFTDAETDPEPDLLENVSWEEVKKYFHGQITALG
ncbi:MAG: hypothetical protein COS89_00440 [Deltaproteobacteria bacterium CG07_land_8_20_14_0_80_38_7]|nr:MAG: hypothetical protein COS89_00440 [Deltaproteobacteria bacterium CG07_land_8_20_14_0_80_38_7]